MITKVLRFGVLVLMIGCKKDDVCYECVTTTSRYVSATSPNAITRDTVIQCGKSNMEQYKLANSLATPGGGSTVSKTVDCTQKP
ncbi:hypothetical protein [Spirosoma fluminis]